MATLYLENVPDELYAKLQQLAAAQNSSIDAQVLTLLESALKSETKPLQVEAPKKSVQEILAEINRRRESLPQDLGLPDSTILLREDRDR